MLRPTDLTQVLEAALANLRSSIDDTRADCHSRRRCRLMNVDAARMTSSIAESRRQCDQVQET